PTAYRLPPTAASGRRGVLLLVVLSLLVMFVLMALTYVLVATKHLSGVRSIGRGASQSAAPPQELLHDAALQVLRGSNNPLSTVGPHSLLEDEYGVNLNSSGNPADPPRGAGSIASN